MFTLTSFFLKPSNQARLYTTLPHNTETAPSAAVAVTATQSRGMAVSGESNTVYSMNSI